MDLGPSSSAAFPVEVLEVIFQHLSPIELLRVAQTSRALRSIATQSILWERTYMAFWREEDIERGKRRGTVQWRDNRRQECLYAIARDAWQRRISARGEHIAEDGDGKRARTAQSIDVPFPLFLSGPESLQDKSVAELAPPPRFYDLFIERIAVDQAVLNVLREQCFSATKWMHRLSTLVSKYGDDIKDVLHALVCVQQRSGMGKNSSKIGTTRYEEGQGHFPNAFQLRLPTTERSPSHHLTLLHYGREMLEHLQCRQAMRGLIAMRTETQSLVHPPPLWAGMHAVYAGKHASQSSPAALAAADLAKQFENGLCWLAMFRGGEGQEVANELDALAVSCALRLAQSDVQVKDDPRLFAASICNFMTSRGFSGAAESDFHNLDNNFIHLCLDESGRQSLPMTLVVIFCSLAARLGLRAYPTNTPGKLMAVVDAVPLVDTPSDADGKTSGAHSESRFWVDVFSSGQIYERGEMRGLFGPRIGISDEATMAQSSPTKCCMRAAHNIIRSVQRAQVAPTLKPSPAGSLISVEGDDAGGSNLRADERFEQLVMAPDCLFNPRRTFLHPVQRDIHLVSPFWTHDSVAGSHRLRRAPSGPFHATPGRFDRVRHWSDATQHAAMHGASNALTRLGDELGERGLDWSMGLVRAFFPLDILVVHEEMTGRPAASVMQAGTLEEDGQVLDTPQPPIAEPLSPLYLQDPMRRMSVQRTLITLALEDRARPDVKARTSDEADGALSPSFDAVHPVGTVFIHRVYHYRAVIVGWDARCNAAEEWIISMGVDALPQGREQPFYNCSVEDGSTRYVAHCNIAPASLEPQRAASADAAATDDSTMQRGTRLTTLQLERLLAMRGIGRSFRCATVRSDGSKLRLVRNEFGRQAFPNDGLDEDD